MYNTPLTLVIVLLAGACGRYSEVDVSSTKSAFKRNKANTRLPFPDRTEFRAPAEGQIIEYSRIPLISSELWISRVDCEFHT